MLQYCFLKVVKEAELTAAAMTVCPFEAIVATVAPMISTSPYPALLGAIKMLTKLIEAHPDKITEEHLIKIMPGLIKVSVFFPLVLLLEYCFISLP